ncbi:Cupin domain protein [Planctomycetes bacterium Pan216]|uniref:Cupin domain protein n=1 Tax=Kolteria novifilia TaxID=2527975 RepID=A0A518B6A2_9BACT|nr:Cupin domain protein [Planctomycetes bacterium Pan216]
MKVCPSESIPAEPVAMEGAKQVSMRVLIGEGDGAPNFVMRQFEVAPGGETPHHSHPYEHEVFVLSGEGVVLEGNEERPLRGGDCVYVASGEVHQFRNTGGEAMKFLCLVPRMDKSC